MNHRILFSLFFLLGSFAQGLSADTNWISGTSGAFTTGSNWDDGVGLTDRTDFTAHISGTSTISAFSFAGRNTVNVGGTGTVTVTGSLNAGNDGVGHLVVADHAVLTPKNSLMIGGNGSYSAVVANNGSTLTLKDDCVLNLSGHFGLGRNSKSTMVQEGNAIFNFNGGGVFVIGEFASNQGSVYYLKGGQLNVNAVPSGYGRVQINSGNSMIQTGGVANIGNASVDVPLQMSGTYTLSGGTLNVSEIKAGGTFNFDGGTLSARTISRSLNQNGGVLSPGMNWDGTGTSIGSTTISGNYTLTSGTLLFELDSLASYDTLNVTGKTTFAKEASIDLVYGDDYAPGWGDSVSLMASAGGYVFPAGVTDLTEMLMPELQAIWQLTNSANGLVLATNANAFPEPSSCLLLLLGLGLLLRVSRFQRR